MFLCSANQNLFFTCKNILENKKYIIKSYKLNKRKGLFIYFNAVLRVNILITYTENTNIYAVQNSVTSLNKNKYFRLQLITEEEDFRSGKL